MKRPIILFLTFMLMLGLLVGCSSSKEEQPVPIQTPSAERPQPY